MTESIVAAARHALVAGREPAEGAVERGRAAIDMFNYDDTFDENAACVIADILHAVKAHGFYPNAVVGRALNYLAEETKGTLSW